MESAGNAVKIYGRNVFRLMESLTVHELVVFLLCPVPSVNLPRIYTYVEVYLSFVLLAD